MPSRVSDSDPRPPYVQIADDLRRQIEAGQLKPRDRLPSMRVLAESYGVAQMTIHHALRTLRTEGRIEAWQGRGTFVAESGEEAPLDEDLHTQVQELIRSVRALDERIARLEGAAEKP
ncbi:GntR family transcriptional regulator [Microlunatus parietis]|uniref:DNA-binding GntR family transcriptional regulator n=1 Tax=Microlunatus parietis TaxID=682979 RepID=A0A7Y9I7Y0_9ACTN|nr:GntR family transcriptional regulator [Microlunatus parietis]NYE71900.1 DNA-binding GntR family transcriptional regulator [Microlunatus parietis]